MIENPDSEMAPLAKAANHYVSQQRFTNQVVSRHVLFRLAPFGCVTRVVGFFSCFGRYSFQLVPNEKHSTYDQF